MFSGSSALNFMDKGGYGVNGTAMTTIAFFHGCVPSQKHLSRRSRIADRLALYAYFKSLYLTLLGPEAD
jgi:hypothetical protein